MIKELQKQIEAEKQKKLQPFYDYMSQILPQVNVSANINDDFDRMEVDLILANQENYTQIEFIFSTKENTMAIFSAAPKVDSKGRLSGIEHIPMKIDTALVFAIQNAAHQVIAEANEEKQPAVVEEADEATEE